jgi:pentatricopeptide repeat protein
MAGCISYLIAVLTTNDQTTVSIIIYAFICGVSGGAYLERLVDKNVNNKIIDFSSTLEEMEKEKNENKKTSAPSNNTGNMHQTDTGVVDAIDLNNENDNTNEEVDFHYNILMKRLKCARSTKEAEKYFNELVRLINNR